MVEAVFALREYGLPPDGDGTWMSVSAGWRDDLLKYNRLAGQAEEALDNPATEMDEDEAW